MESGLPWREETVRRLAEATENDLHSHLSLNDLADLKNRLQRHDRALRQMRDEVGSESERLEQFLSQIRTRREVWQLTRQTGRANGYPPTVFDAVEQTLRNLDQGREQIAENRGRLLGLQNLIVALRGELRTGINAVTAAEEEILGQLYSFEGPYLWDLSEIDTGRLWPRFRDQLVRGLNSFREYAAENVHWIVFSLLFVLILSLTLRRLREEPPAGEAGPAGGGGLLQQRPISASVVVVLFANSLFHPDAPRSWFDAISIIGLVAMVRLVPCFVPRRFIPLAFVLLGVRALELVNSQAPGGSSLGRLLTLLILGVFGVTLVRLKSRLRSARDPGSAWIAVILAACWAGLLILAVAVLSGIFGNLALTGLLTGGTVRLAYLGVALAVVFTVNVEILRHGLASRLAGRSRLIRNNRELIDQKGTRILGAVVILAGAVWAPAHFALLDPLAARVGEILTTPVQLQALSFSLGDLLAILIVAWLSFQVSQFICFILEEDFLPRFALPKGVPAAISRLTYYSLLVLGFLIALTAGGFDLSRVTLLAGAFGVGLGFGLQNIVNNFVSGLILLFERPVRVGDRVQLEQDLTGEVVKIGIRACVVKTFDGAEVLVPNGQLISDRITNWTLSDARRRISISVGVAYGTQPGQVLEILEGVAAANPDVLQDPAPQALFIGFGDSSLDFVLRAWVRGFDAGLQVKSDLTTAVCAALTAAGIEIPFPQRDVHVRSVNGRLELDEPTGEDV